MPHTFLHRTSPSPRSEKGLPGVDRCGKETVAIDYLLSVQSILFIRAENVNSTQHLLGSTERLGRTWISPSSTYCASEELQPPSVMVCSQTLALVSKLIYVWTPYQKRNR